MAATATLTHAAALVRASDFVELGKLQTYEDMRDRGALVYKDNVDALAHPSVTYLFLSHQWTSWTEPDPTGKQYAAMVSAVQSVVAAEGWRLAETLVWCDYFSIPQRCLSEQEAAIKSLVSFASCASAFVAVAPPASIHDFSFLAPCPASGLMVHGDSDDIIPEESVAKLADKLGKQKNITIDYNVVKGCDHFFRNHLDQMEKHVEKYLDANLETAE